MLVIYRYSQVFNAVSSCHAADVPSVSDLIPNSMNHVHTMFATVSVIRARNSSKLEGRSGTKTLSLTYPHTEKSRGVKSGDHGGQAIVPPRPIQATLCHVT